MYRLDRIGDSHGGIYVYIRNNIFSCCPNDLELPDIECVWIEIKTHKHNIKRLHVIGTIYRPSHFKVVICGKYKNLNKITII